MIMTALFVTFAAIMVVSSLFMVLHKNPVTSALFLVVTFCSLAGIYLLLQAEFLGMVQIVVYAGAIMVLFLFVIMYLNLGQDVERGAQMAVRRVLGWAIGAMLLLQAAMLVGRGWVSGPTAPENVAQPAGNTQAIGAILYTKFLFPFELTSILLLVAMVGAVVIARGRLGGTFPGLSPATARLERTTPAAAPAAPAAPAVSTEIREPVGAGAGSGSEPGGHA